MAKIEFMKKAHPVKTTKNILHPIFKKWFFGKFKDFSEPQKYSIYNIHCRVNTLVSSPTGSGKTISAFGAILNELIGLSEKKLLEDKVYCLYISPLKALSNDIEKNLKEPLAEMEKQCGKELGIRIGVRTGDTSTKERVAMTKNPPHILITTPESVAILLTSKKFVNHLKDINWMIIDEIHALAENKRGTHLSMSMEMLSYLSSHMTRIGLSATVSPLEKVAEFLVGPKRDCKIVNTQFIKQLDLKVISPVDDLINITYNELHKKSYALINKMVMKHKTTLIFTNTRAATERIVHYLQEKYPKNYFENIGAHHGSLSKEFRTRIESQLRAGKLKCIVCSTSLELGIDIGYIDLVICLGSPKSVARLLQRIGRSGHQLHEVTKGRILVMDRDDLVECSLMLKAAVEKKIDKLHIPQNALDVLAQQIYGFTLIQKWTEEELYEVIKKSYCYKDLTYDQYNEILDYLSGSYSSLEDRSIYAKIWRKDGMIGTRGKMARVIYMTNVGTIPDTSRISVKLGNQRIGSIDEGFLEKLRKRDIFVLGGGTYEFRYSRGMVATVSSSIGKPPTVPNWFSEMLPLSYDLANDIQKFRFLIEDKLIAKRTQKDILDFIKKYLYVDNKTAKAIYSYLKEQYLFSIISNEKKILIEYYNDGKNKKAIFHTLFGRRVNDCLSRLLAYSISRSTHKDVEIAITDNGFVIGHNGKINFIKALNLLKSKDIEKIMENALEKSEILKRRFRHCANRAMMILRNYKGHTKRVGRQQVSSDILYHTVMRIDPGFFIIKEAKREVMKDLMDIENTKKVIEKIEKKQFKIEERRSEIPSPFAFNLVLQGVSEIIKLEDKAEFLKRMHSYVLAKISLKSKQEDMEEISYEKYWEHEEEIEANKRRKELDDKELLLEMLKVTYKKVGFDVGLYSNLQDLVNGKRKGFVESFKVFIEEITKKPYPKKWHEELILWLDEIKGEIE